MLARSRLSRIGSHILHRTMCSAAAPTLEVEQFLCLSDNYGYLIHDAKSQTTAAIDTPEYGPIVEAIERRGWGPLTHILNTHWHADHTGANLSLKNKFSAANVQVVGPVDERDKIPGIDVAVGGGDVVDFGSFQASVIDVGGHTKGHIAFVFEETGHAFVGDALFALGCGRMFEGTPDQMWAGLDRLRGLPDSTQVYCAHEYTLSNARFSSTVDPNNADLMAYVAEVEEKRARGERTVPTTIAREKATNPFLRPESKSLRDTLGLTASATNVEVFAEVRKRKDNF